MTIYPFVYEFCVLFTGNHYPVAVLERKTTTNYVCFSLFESACYFNLKTAVGCVQPVAGSNFGVGRGGNDANNFLNALCAMSLTLPATPNCSAARVSSLKNFVSSCIAACTTVTFAWVLVTVTVV